MLEFFGDNWIQPQLFTLIFITILILIFSLVIYIQVKKVKKDKTPNSVAFIAEKYVFLINDLVEDNSDNKLNKIAPYFLTLFTFVFFGNIVSLIGLEPIGTSYSLTFSLALISWLGIYVTGFIFQKFKFLLKFLKNPLDIIGVQATLLSLSLRMFGNIVAGASIFIILNAFTIGIWSNINIPILSEINILGVILALPFKFYFDIFGAIIQSFIFMILTISYWTTEAETSEKKKKYKTKKVL